MVLARSGIRARIIGPPYSKETYFLIVVLYIHTCGPFNHWWTFVDKTNHSAGRWQLDKRKSQPLEPKKSGGAFFGAKGIWSANQERLLAFAEIGLFHFFLWRKMYDIAIPMLLCHCEICPDRGKNRDSSKGFTNTPVILIISPPPLGPELIIHKHLSYHNIEKIGIVKSRMRAHFRRLKMFGSIEACLWVGISPSFPPELGEIFFFGISFYVFYKKMYWKNWRWALGFLKRAEKGVWLGRDGFFRTDVFCGNKMKIQEFQIWGFCRIARFEEWVWNEEWV